ncbi:hypothetical protein LK994_12110 [Ferruginibacter lapsinanis]|uniref:hypothetical protein n=1 Tax=Ferruginibacter lapsinanis TaxID=563172 RepID=UPI001E54A275|nr:hypothetical protein [Ferruginibacter lapsinanis]UEG49376.1 hypothetical protein LK994_12110 [Ferruginibacter lapsinanis]
MKQLIVTVIAFLLFATTVEANTLATSALFTDTSGIEKKQVKVTNWGSRAIYIMGGYFKETKDEIVSQTGEALFEEIENKCSSAAWPAALNDMDSEDSIVTAKMNRLKLYRIATYQHKFNGNVFDKYVILEVPYVGNEDWDANVKWEGSVYFIIKEKDIEVIP